MMESNPVNWVPVYFEGGVTIGKAKISDDQKTIEIELNEGSTIGAAIAEGLVGITTMSMATNDAQVIRGDDSDDKTVGTN
jgi:hypothetical protein